MQQNRMRRAAVAFAALTVGHFVWLRSILQWCARIAGWVRLRLQSGWLGLTILYFFAALLVVLHGLLVKAIPLSSPPITAPARTSAGWWAYELLLLKLNARPISIWFFHGAAGPWVQAVALAALIVLVGVASRTRKRIVILSFANLSGDENQKDFVNSLPRRLMTELAEVADIHTQLRDDPGDLSLDSGPAPRLEVDPTSSATSGLKGALTGVTVPIGPVKIPLDGAVTLLSTLLQGPQIVGSLQSTSEGLLIEASLSGGSRPAAWRVKAQDAEKNRAREESNVGIADLMVRQLAYRIFTYLNAQHLGTTSWRAVGYYTEGLRAVRVAALERRQTTKRLLALEHAQREFFRAFREDVRFVRSRYNLGVILFSQRRWQPACEVFQAVVNDIEGDPLPTPFGSPAYKRARRDLASAHFAAASAFCAQVRDLNAQQKINEEWAVMAGFQAEMMEKAARNTLDRLNQRKPDALARERPIFTKIKVLLKQQRSGDPSLQANRSPEVLLYEMKNLRRAVQVSAITGRSADRKVVADDGPAILQALGYIIDRQQQFVRLGRARYIRGQVSAVNAWGKKMRDQHSPSRQVSWISRRVDYHLDMALRINPAASDAWNLKGERETAIDHDSKSGSLDCFRRAVALIWLQLCLAQWNNEPTPALLLEAVTYLANLSRNNPRNGSAAGEIDQALVMDPSNAANWVSQGKLHLMAGCFKDALGSFQNANRERELGIHWLWIAFTCRAASLLADPRKPCAETWRKTEWDALRRAVEGCAGESLFPPPAPRTMRADAPPQVGDFLSGIYLDGRFELFQQEVENLTERMQILTSTQKHMLRQWAERIDQRLQWMLWGVESRKAKLLDLASEKALQLAGTVFPEERIWKRMLSWIDQAYRTDVAARESLVDVTSLFLGIFYSGRFAISQEQFSQAIWLVSRAVDTGPIEADQRMLLANFYLLTGLPDQSQEEITNAVNIRPDRNFETGTISTMLRKVRDITDKRMSAEALRRIVAVCKALADGEAYDLSRHAFLGAWGYWHFYLGTFSLEILDYTTAQRCFATCWDRRQYPIESLQLLCYANFRCGAFEAAENAYRRIVSLFREVAPPRQPANMPSKAVKPGKPPRKLPFLQSSQALNALNIWREQSSPAWNRAMAANHTAAAMADQGLTSEACKRWKISKKWARFAQQPDRQQFLEAAQYLCQGVILLNAGNSGGPVEDPDPANPPDPAASSMPAPAPPAASQPEAPKTAPPSADVTAPATGESTEGAHQPDSPATPQCASAVQGASTQTEDPRVKQLKKAIRCFTISIGYAQDPANRADANFRIGIACDSLAHLDSTNADSWKRQGRRALRNAQNADRRDEYADLIGPLMKKLGGDLESGNDASQSSQSSPANTKTKSASGTRTAPTPS